jgi:thioesterase domain-containing protein
MVGLNAVEMEARVSCRAVEDLIREIWSGHFGRDVSPYDDFFDLGGDSLAIIDVVAKARERGLFVRSSVALRHPTPARLAEALTVGAAEPTLDLPPVRLPALYDNASRSVQLRAAKPPTHLWSVPIGAGGTGEPVYVVHSDSHLEAERAAVAGWGCTRPVRGYAPHRLRGLVPPVAPLGGIAAELRQALRAEQADGPYRLVGFGAGAVLAVEVARQLGASGATVAALVLVRPVAGDPGAAPHAGRDRLLRQRLAGLADRFGLTGAESLEEIHARVRADGWYDDSVRPWDLPWLQMAAVELALAAREHEPARFDGPVTVIQDTVDSAAGGRRWTDAAADAELHRFDHGIESPLAVLTDARLAPIARKALDA